MKSLDKVFISIIVFGTVFMGLCLTIPRNRIILHMPSEDTISSNPEQKIDTQKVVTTPGCDVYEIKNNQPVRLGNLIGKSFSCVILKEMKLGPVKYYLIQITEPGYKPDKWIVRDGGIMFLELIL